MKRNILGTVILIALGQQPMFEQLIADLPPTPRLPAAHAFNRVVLLGEKDQMSATLDIIVANGRVSVENAHISSAMSVDGIQMSDTLNKGGNVMFMGSAEDLRDAMFMLFRKSSKQLNIEANTTIAVDYTFDGENYGIMMISKRNCAAPVGDASKVTG